MGLGGDKIDNLGELTVKVRTERHGGGDILSRMTFQGAKVRKPQLAVSGVIDKGNIVFFSMEMYPSYCQIRVQVWHL